MKDPKQALAAESAGSASVKARRSSFVKPSGTDVPLPFWASSVKSGGFAVVECCG